MGMFDEVVCEYPLPDPTHNNITFQTKSIDPSCDTYLITKDGRLFRTAFAFGNPLETPEEMTDFHQDIRMYMSIPREKPPEGYHLGAQNKEWFFVNWKTKERIPTQPPEWIEYVVRFTEGRVSRVTRVEGQP